MDTSEPFQQRRRASVKANFVVSLRIAKAKKPLTIAEQFILPCARDINRILFGKEAKSMLNVLSLSDNTVRRRISLMFDKIKNQVIDQMKSAGSFAPQVDEPTGVLFCAQLIGFVRYVNNGVFKDEFVCRGAGFFCVHGLGLEPCVLDSTSVSAHIRSAVEITKRSF